MLEHHLASFNVACAGYSAVGTWKTRGYYVVRDVVYLNIKKGTPSTFHSSEPYLSILCIISANVAFHHTVTVEIFVFLHNFTV